MLSVNMRGEGEDGFLGWIL